MSNVPDINDSEFWIVDSTLRERYGRQIDIQLADSEIRLSLSDRETTSCPALYWQANNCNFVIFKTGDNRYRCQFFYKPYKQMGTGIPEYDNLTECVVSLLQVQTDHMAEQQEDKPSRSATS